MFGTRWRLSGVFPQPLDTAYAPLFSLVTMPGIPPLR